MVRRRRSFNPFVLLLLGIVAGIVVVLWDRGNAPSSEIAQIPAASTLAVVGSPAAEAVATQAVAPRGVISGATLFIPSAGVMAPVVPVYLDGESWDVSRLGSNIGHLQGTAWFDQPGNVVLSGHVELSDGRRGVFATLKEMQQGERILLTYEGVEREYDVTEVRNVEPNDLTPLYPTGADRLTLITCDAYDFFQNTYQQRVVVVAERIR